RLPVQSPPPQPSPCGGGGQNGLLDFLFNPPTPALPLRGRGPKRPARLPFNPPSPALPLRGRGPKRPARLPFQSPLPTPPPQGEAGRGGRRGAPRTALFSVSSSAHGAQLESPKLPASPPPCSIFRLAQAHQEARGLFQFAGGAYLEDLGALGLVAGHGA